jgi:protease I
VNPDRLAHCSGPLFTCWYEVGFFRRRNRASFAAGSDVKWRSCSGCRLCQELPQFRNRLIVFTEWKAIAMSSDGPLAGKSFLCFVGEAYEDLEVWYPKLRLIEAGGKFVAIGQDAGVCYSGKHGYPCVSDAAIAGTVTDSFDGLICAGGWMPDKLRRDPEVLRITREFANAGKMVAAICHGGWIPISAGVYKDVKVTGSPGIKDDLSNAGAVFEDASVVVDQHFISSRRPEDLPDFCREIIGHYTQVVS